MPKSTSRIFLDTSVILAAFGSSKGGSSLIINNQGKAYHCVVSVDIVLEALSKADKFGATEEEIKDWIGKKNILVTQSPTDREKAKFDKIVVDRKDRHVLAAVRKNRADYLLSYDRKHIVVTKVKKTLRSTKVMTPKEFLQKKPLE